MLLTPLQVLLSPLPAQPFFFFCFVPVLSLLPYLKLLLSLLLIFLFCPCLPKHERFVPLSVSACLMVSGFLPFLKLLLLLAPVLQWSVHFASLHSVSCL